MSYLWKRVTWSVHPDTESVCVQLCGLKLTSYDPFLTQMVYICIYKFNLPSLLSLGHYDESDVIRQARTRTRTRKTTHASLLEIHYTGLQISNGHKLQDTFHIRQTHENLLVRIDCWTEINIKHNRVKFYIRQSHRGRELYCRCAWVNESLSSCLCLCICTSTDTEWRPGWLYPPGPLLLVFDWKHESGSSVRTQNTITAHIIRDIL